MRRILLLLTAAFAALQMAHGLQGSVAPARPGRARSVRAWGRKPRIGFGDGEGKFSVDVNEFTERIESVKAGAVGGLSASVAYALPGLLYTSTAQWEFDTDMAALSGLLFGIVYRYAVREDSNPNLKQGVVGAFAITRLLAKVRVPDYCVPIPLNCGAPLGYFDENMLGQMAVAGFASFAAYGAAAVALEVAFSQGWVKPFPSR